MKEPENSNRINQNSRLSCLNQNYIKFILLKTFGVNLTLKKHHYLKIGYWVTLFQELLNFHSLEWDSTPKISQFYK